MSYTHVVLRCKVRSMRSLLADRPKPDLGELPLMAEVMMRSGARKLTSGNALAGSKTRRGYR